MSWSFATASSVSSILFHGLDPVNDRLTELFDTLFIGGHRTRLPTGCGLEPPVGNSSLTLFLWLPDNFHWHTKFCIPGFEHWAHEIEQKKQPLEIASTIKPNFLTRFLLEFDRRIGPNWAVAARYIQTKSDDMLEILTIFNLNTQYKLLYDNFEHKRRKYSGIELELTGRIGPGFFLNASYCYSSAEGTNPGQPESGTWSQDDLNTSYLGLFGNHLNIPDLPGLKEIKDYFDWALGGLGGRGIGDEGWYGKLPYSVDHNFKLLAVMAAPFGFVFSTAFEYISGYYWEKRGYSPFFGKYITFPETRGSRKTPAHIFLDLGIEKKFKPPGFGLTPISFLTLRLDVSNLLNSQRPISFVKEDIPIFGDVWARQQPRRARITAKLSW